MNDKQIATVLMQLHKEKIKDVDGYLVEKLKYFNLNEKDQESFLGKLKNKYEKGIKQLNSKQLTNIQAANYTNDYDIKSKLEFYEIEEDCYENIIDFLKMNSLSNSAISVHDIDENFKGVQITSTDDFNMIIDQGYTGDWVLKPASIKHNYVQVASKNETGMFPRGSYLNAEIDKIEPIEDGEQTRYRIFFKNPVIIDSGNRNIKFKTNPVKYINK